ncbi:MAG: hypothetical protein GMKNLPBB_01454 [Myxococcota bacterium]|nr:hypothetical protein [Myxococcota bacterium]
MSMFIRFRKWWLLGALWLMTAMACDGGCSGCSCLAPIPGGYPVPKLMDNSTQIRLTSSGIDFIEQNLGPIVSSLLPTGLSFDVPPTETSVAVIGKVEVCKSGSGCKLNATIKQVNLLPRSTDNLDINIALDLKGQIKPVKVGFLGTCTIDVDIVNKPVKAPLKFKNHAKTKRMQFDIGKVDVKLDDKDFKIKDCFIGSVVELLSFLKSLIVDQLTKQFDLNKILQEQIQNFSRQPCKDNPAVCPTSLGYQCNSEKLCQDPGTKEYAPNVLGLEGIMDAGALFGGLAPGLDAKMDLGLIAGGKVGAPYVDPQSTGLRVGIMGGAQSKQNSCVPLTQPPPVLPIQDIEFINANDYKGEKFHVGIGVAKLFLDTSLWSAFNAGVLCISLGTDTVDQISTGTLGVLIQSLSTLTNGKNMPVILSLRPEQAPTLDIGEGVYKDDGSGKLTLDRPLLNVTLKDFSIDIYAFYFDRYARVLTITTDVQLPIGLSVAFDAKSGKAQLVPILGDLAKAFTNVRVTNTEPIADDPKAIADALPVLIGALGGQLGSALKPFDLFDPKDLRGFELKIKKITGVTPFTGPCNIPADKGGCYQFLGIFADLGFNPAAAGGGKPIVFSTDTWASVYKKNSPTWQSFVATHGQVSRPAPEVTLQVGGMGPDGQGANLEYSYRVDGGFWSPWHNINLITVSDPRFWLVGKHKIEVVSRVIGEVSSQDPTPAVVEFMMDPYAPKVSARMNPATSHVTFIASDEVTPEDKIEFAFNVNGGPYTNWSAMRTFDFAAYDGVDFELNIEARDEEGNIGRATLKRSALTPASSGNGSGQGAGLDAPDGPELGSHGRESLPGAGSGCNCNLWGASEEGAMGMAIMTIFVAMTLHLMGRRKKRA